MVDTATDLEPFQLRPGLGPDLLRRIRRPLETLLAFRQLNTIYRQTRRAAPDLPFGDRALAALGVSHHLSDFDLRRIPATGPLVVVANHPFGGIDGLLLISILQRVRPDVKVLANRLLEVLPELRDTSFFVDAFAGPQSARENAGVMRRALKWVREGGVLAIFPAGEVSHLDLRARRVTDPPWSPVAARLIRRSQAAVLPIHFGGRNSAAFQAAGLIHPRLRTALLPRELLKHRRRVIDVRVGNVIAHARLVHFDDGELASYLRVRTYLLSGRSPQRKGESIGLAPASGRQLAPVADPEAAEALAAEAAALPAEQVIAVEGRARILIARAEQASAILREIGRLREISFRAVGEGTGRPRDIDRFDEHYQHLFVWDDSRREVVGAYRLGLTDEIIRCFGLPGLYTHSLFRYRQALLDQIGPAIELGRSFVRVERQKEYAPLMLLWKGIARFVAANPRYKKLFGPVSISNDYQCMTRRILVAFLRMNRFLPNLGKLLSGRNGARWKSGHSRDDALMATLVRDANEVDELVADIETDRKGMPPLLKQYLKLNAKLLGFNVDPNFGNALDALMLVDLTDVPHAILARYMGMENAARFLAFHKINRK